MIQIEWNIILTIESLRFHKLTCSRCQKAFGETLDVSNKTVNHTIYRKTYSDSIVNFFGCALGEGLFTDFTSESTR